LMAPLDGDDNYCGYFNEFDSKGKKVDSDLKDYPKLYLTDFTIDVPNEIFAKGVCVKECPKIVGVELPYHATSEIPFADGKKTWTSKFETHDVLNYCYQLVVVKISTRGWMLLREFFKKTQSPPISTTCIFHQEPCSFLAV